MQTKVEKPTATDKPRKPHPDFPLTPHPTGRWCKKVRGKLHYFGKTAGDEQGQAALNLWLEQKDDLLAGRTPRARRDGLTVRDLVNHYLTSKKMSLENKEIRERHFGEQWRVCDLLGQTLGLSRLVDDLACDDFDKLTRTMAKQWGLTRRGNITQQIKSVFNYGVAAGLVERLPRYGANFKRPAKAAMRKQRAAKGQRMFEADELRRILDAATMPMKAMILLGANCAFGNSDVANLETSMVDFSKGYINYARPKTGIDRLCRLWPETIAALEQAAKERPAAKVPEAANRFFVTRLGRPWGSVRLVTEEDGTIKTVTDDPVNKEFTKLIKSLGLHRPGLGFYGLRHGFETIASGSRDQVAVNAIMGHADASMAGVYRERIDNDRLDAVAEHVRRWLFPPKAKGKAKPEATSTPKARKPRLRVVRAG